MEEQLGKVGSVFFGLEDHGILSFMIHLDFGGTGQGFGGYALDGYSKEKKRRIGTAAGTDLVLRLLTLFGVRTLEEIKGRSVFALRESVQISAKIIGLRLPEFDGGTEFLIEDWQNEFYPPDSKD